MCELALGEFVQEVGGQLKTGSMPPLAGEATPLGRIVTDSRQIQSGDVFWALRGPHHDGADFADEALSRGASGVVVSNRRIEPWAGRWAVEVEDTNRALWQLAAAVRQQFAGSVIAVTGSVGKSTTRQMIHHVLASRLDGSASPHNFNNHIGVPLSIFQWKMLDDFAVLELGASSRGEIDALAGLCDPHIGVITCIGEAHLDGFGDVDTIAQSKAELLEALPPNGWAVLGGDDPLLRRMASKCRAKIVWVGRSADCDLVATDVSASTGVLSFCADGHPYKVPVSGRHHLTSALAAIAVGRTMDMAPCEIATALETFSPLPQRCDLKQAAQATIIDDSYNASPTSMRAALELLRDFEASGRRIVVCGDMKELGESATDWHKKLGEQIVTVCGADLLIACGEFAQQVVEAARQAGMVSENTIAVSEPHQAVAELEQRLTAGDVVLVKGSRAMKLEQIVQAISKDRSVHAA